MIKHVLSLRLPSMPATKNSGFTLIELAVVLFLVSLVLGGVMTPLATRVEQEGRRKTQDLLNEARDSLIGYALINGHLPCPDCPANGADPDCGAAPVVSNDGIEDGLDAASNPLSPRTLPANDFASCAVTVGNLPWVTLGLSEFDAWDNRFVYAVDSSYADNVAGQAGDGCTATAGISFSLCSVGNINVHSATPTVPANRIAENIPVMIMSYGANGESYGGVDVPTSANELENWWTDVDNTFVSTDYNQSVGGEFDDMLVWITSSTLVYKMVNAERLP